MQEDSVLKKCQELKYFFGGVGVWMLYTSAIVWEYLFYMQDTESAFWVYF